MNDVLNLVQDRPRLLQRYPVLFPGIFQNPYHPAGPKSSYADIQRFPVCIDDSSGVRFPIMSDVLSLHLLHPPHQLRHHLAPNTQAVVFLLTDVSKLTS